jgi:hypothetical protein
MTSARQERSYLVRQTAGKIAGDQAIMSVPRCLGSDRIGRGPIALSVG